MKGKKVYRPNIPMQQTKTKQGRIHFCSRQALLHRREGLKTIIEAEPRLHKLKKKD